MQTQTLTRPKNLSASLSAASICADVLALFIGLGSAYTVKLVGDFPLSEIFVIVSVPILFALRPERIFRPDFKTAFLLLGRVKVCVCIAIFRPGLRMPWVI